MNLPFGYIGTDTIGLILTIIAGILVFTVFTKDIEEISKKKSK